MKKFPIFKKEIEVDVEEIANDLVHNLNDKDVIKLVKYLEANAESPNVVIELYDYFKDIYDKHNLYLIRD